MQEQNMQHPDCGIYCIDCLATGKKYIGQSIHIQERWQKHKAALRHNNHENDYLQKAWNKYGAEQFQWTVLEYCTSEQLDEREQYYIAQYDTMNKECGYNLKSGGQFMTNVYTAELRNKMSEAVQRSYTDELRQKRSEQAKAQWSNPETRAKMTGINHGRYGKHLSPDARKRIGDAQRNKPSFRRNWTPVYCVELNKQWACAHDAAQELNEDSGSILKACRGELHTYHKRHWQFVTNEK